MLVVKRKRKNSESLSKPGKQNTDINNETEESVKDANSNISGINTGVDMISPSLLWMLLAVVPSETVSSKMIFSQKYNSIKNVFKPGQYFPFPVTGQNVVFS